MITFKLYVAFEEALEDGELRIMSSPAVFKVFLHKDVSGLVLMKCDASQTVNSFIDAFYALKRSSTQNLH